MDYAEIVDDTSKGNTADLALDNDQVTEQNAEFDTEGRLSVQQPSCSSDKSRIEVVLFVQKLKHKNETYKIEDHIALQNLPSLLTGRSAIWWIDVGDSVHTFEEALDLYLKTFGPAIPNSQIYREIFKKEQGEEPVHVFVCRFKIFRKRLSENVLANKIDNTDLRRFINHPVFKKVFGSCLERNQTDIVLSKNTQLDMVYGLLHMRIRERVPRTSFRTLKELSELSSHADSIIEESRPQLIVEKTFRKPEHVFPRYCYACLQDVTGDSCVICNNSNSFNCVNSLRRTNISKDPLEKECHNLYDYSELCTTVPNLGSPASPPFDEGRPVIAVDVYGCMLTMVVDTAAKYCVAGTVLYKMMVRMHHQFRIRFASDTIGKVEIRIVDLKVRLLGKIIEIPFVISPYLKNSDSLLGIDFLLAAKMVLDFGSDCWHFADDPEHHYPFQHTMSIFNMSHATRNSILRHDEATCLLEHERTNVVLLLRENEDIFFKGGGETPYAVHEIETVDCNTIKIEQDQCTYEKLDCTTQALSKMLNDGLIEECSGSWSAPVHFIPKINGSMQFYVDYRCLNAVTKSQTYPILKIEELSHFNNNKCYISTLGFQAGYWQLNIREEDKDKTAFKLPQGYFRFKKLPSGLKNARTTFSKFIDYFRSDRRLQNITVLAYFDDILIISDSYRRHMKDLTIVFDRLRELKLYVNRKKSVLFRESITHLSYIISQKGYEYNPTIVQSVLKEDPENQRSLDIFVLLCSWFQKFHPKLSKIIPILTRAAASAKHGWRLNKEQLDIFCLAQSLILSDQKLCYVNYDLPFIIRVDYSNYYTLTVYLLQEVTGEEIPIDFACRLLTPAERGYSNVEREALGILYSVEKFKHSINDRPIFVYSEFKQSAWSHGLTMRAIQIGLNLQRSDITYIFDKVKTWKDTHYPLFYNDGSEVVCGVCKLMIKFLTRRPKYLRRIQFSDLALRNIIKDLESKEIVRSSKWIEDGYVLQKGVLYRLHPDAYKEISQLVIPSDLSHSILNKWRSHHADCHLPYCT